jgi:hypothetical protein
MPHINEVTDAALLEQKNWSGFCASGPRATSGSGWDNGAVLQLHRARERAFASFRYNPPGKAA